MLYVIENLLKRRQREQGYRLLIRSLHIPRGARLAITGPSGCGKSTTLDLLGLALRPDSAARFTFAPDPDAAPLDVTALWAGGRHDAMAALRLAHMGYVLQSGELLPFLTVGENMTLTARLGGMPDAEAEARARGLAEALGVAHLRGAMPATLSVGERQRAAIVRALTPGPQLILADEPTAALDPVHAGRVMDAFLAALDLHQGSLVLVTHNAGWARRGGLTELAFRMEEDEGGVTAVLDDDAGAATGSPGGEGAPC
ncbi:MULTISPECIES: ATP-binding cassette domain-containing protein [unclassified Desulfovibrio]|uniref:ABC transporter ATP-binding protein n=1 Tax=unclassified Desulfovibrio TaxID=2593640 RepID=UPI0013ED3DDB|nr:MULTISPECIES: ATP-binding cassette domain-containing protein [unclassified Desulfovibrio]